MKNIFISGGVLNGFTEKIDDLFLRTIDLNKPLLYVGTAKVRANKQDGYFNRLKSVFKKINEKNFIMQNDLGDLKIEDLNNFSSIYIGGGNTFDLLNHFKKTGFGKVLFCYINKGGVVFGESAGAIILGKTIKTSLLFDKNYCDLQDFQGLNVLRGFSVACHYEKQHKIFLEDVKIKNETNIIALPSGKGLQVTNNIMNEKKDIFVY